MRISRTTTYAEATLKIRASASCRGPRPSPRPSPRPTGKRKRQRRNHSSSRKEDPMSQIESTADTPETPASAAEQPGEATCESPPPVPQPPRDGAEAYDPRVRLLQLAAELMRSQNRRLVIEYLRLRRAL